MHTFKVKFISILHKYNIELITVSNVKKRMFFNTTYTLDTRRLYSDAGIEYYDFEGYYQSAEFEIGIIVNFF